RWVGQPGERDVAAGTVGGDEGSMGGKALDGGVDLCAGWMVGDEADEGERLVDRFGRLFPSPATPARRRLRCQGVGRGFGDRLLRPRPRLLGAAIGLLGRTDGDP